MVNRYTGERFSPRVPTCGRSIFSLHFDGRTLCARGSRTLINFSAVSGRDKNGKFNYTPENQKISDRGPIPEGEYWIQPSELQENAWFRLKNPRAGWGNYWITIHPYPNTQTYKRGGFFIHGGNTPGSAGCIDLSLQMNRFVAVLQKELAGKSKCYIPLTVQYVK